MCVVRLLVVVMKCSTVGYCLADTSSFFFDQKVFVWFGLVSACFAAVDGSIPAADFRVSS